MAPTKNEMALTLPPVERLPSLRLVSNLPMIRSTQELAPEEGIVLRNFHRQLVETEAEREKIKFSVAATADLELATYQVYERTVFNLAGYLKDAEGCDYFSHLKQVGEYLMQVSVQDYLVLREIGREYIAKVAAEDMLPPPAPPLPHGFLGRLKFLLSGT